MKAVYTEEFERRFRSLPRLVQAKFAKQLGFLLADLRHPSLRAKKYDDARDIWQARVDRSFRFYFQISGDAYILLSIIAHPK